MSPYIKTFISWRVTMRQIKVNVTTTLLIWCFSSSWSIAILDRGDPSVLKSWETQTICIVKMFTSLILEAFQCHNFLLQKHQTSTAHFIFGLCTSYIKKIAGARVYKMSLKKACHLKLARWFDKTTYCIQSRRMQFIWFKAFLHSLSFWRHDSYWC